MPRRVQPSGSVRAVLAVALPIATLGCAKGAMSVTADADPLPDATHQSDAAHPDAANITADAAPDAGCAISAGMTPSIDCNDDLSKYPASQRLKPGAMLATDSVALAWNATELYVTVGSTAFTSPYEPLHIYVQTGTALASSMSAQGKEYGGLTPQLPFTPTYLIGVRRVSDAGTGGYDGVFAPSDQWQTRLYPLDADTFASPDQHQLSVRVPWTALGGCPSAMRIAIHVVHAVAGNEWKDLVPTTHTPWQAPGGGYYEIDLTASEAVTNWTLH
jgi:hypothetical protein